MLSPTPLTKQGPSPEKSRNHVVRTFPVWQVWLSIIAGYILASSLTMRSINQWARNLPSTETSELLVTWSDRTFKKTAAKGFDQPESAVEKWFSLWHDRLTIGSAAQLAEFRKKQSLRHHRQLSSLPSTLLLGDSLMTKLGPALQQAITAELGGNASVLSKIGSGLSRPDVFDWPSAMRSELNSHKFNSLVILIGTNDAQNLIEHGEAVTFGTPEWIKTYKLRLHSVMKIACQHTERAIWLSLPPMRDEAFQRKMLLLNALAHSVSSAHDCFKYVPLATILSPEDGTFTTYLQIKSEEVKVRASDGIHLTVRGSELITQSLLPLLKPSKPLPNSAEVSAQDLSDVALGECRNRHSWITTAGCSGHH